MMKGSKLIKFEITIFLIICMISTFNLICYLTKNTSRVINKTENLKYLAYNENSYMENKNDEEFDKEALTKEKVNYMDNIWEVDSKNEDNSPILEKAEKSAVNFELKKIDGDTNEPLSDAKFIVYTRNEKGEKDFAKDVNGNYIGTGRAEEAINLELSSTGEEDIWRKNEDNVWVADSGWGSIPILTSNEFEISDGRTISFEYTVDSSYKNEGFGYLITNTETNEIVSEYTESGYGNGWKKHKIDLDAGKYIISFKYNNDVEGFWWLENTAYVKNVQIDPYTMFVVTSNELGKIEMELPENIYDIIEIEASEKYELPENKKERTYYFGTNNSKEEELYTAEWAVSNTGIGMYSSETKIIIETSDGGYLAGGNFQGTINLDGEVIKAKGINGLLVKYNAEGKIEWISNVESVTYITSVIETKDNEYLALGYSSVWNGNYYELTIQVLKYDANGKIIWTDNFKSNSSFGNSASIVETNNGEYIVTGNFKGSKIEFKDNKIEPIIKDDSDNTYVDAIIVKYDKEGNVINAKSFGGNGYDYIESIIKTDDGGYIVGGEYSSSEINLDDNNKLTSEGKYDGFLIRYDQNDQVVWATSIGGAGFDFIYSMTKVEDNKFIVGGYFDSQEINLNDNHINNSEKCEKALLIEYNLDGEVIWSTNFGGNESNYQIKSVSQTDDGGFIVGGNFNAKMPIELNSYKIEPRSDRTNTFLVKYDKEKNVEWADSVGGEGGSCWLNSVSDSIDKGFMIAGSFNSRPLMIGDYKLKYTSTRYDKDKHENSFVAKYGLLKYPRMSNILIKNYLKEEYRKDIVVSKTWKDNNNHNETRPEKIKLVLVGSVNDNEIIKKEVLIPNEETEIINQNTWRYTFKSLPKINVKGNEIIYKVYEEEVNESDLAEYTSKISEINKDNECEVTNIQNGTYNLELIKQDKENEERLSNATFSVQIGKGEEKEYTTDENGIISIPNIEIKEAGTETIKITEIKSPAGYIKTEGTLEIIVNKVEINEGYLIDSIETKNKIEGATILLNNGKISVNIDNTKITGKYEIELLKQDKKSQEKLSGVEFAIQVGNEEEKVYTTDENGIISIPNIEIKEVGTEIIKIKETKAQEGYIKNEETLEIIATKSESNGKYILNKLETKNEMAMSVVSLTSEEKISIVVNNRKEEIFTYKFKLIKKDKALDVNLDGADFSIQIGNKEPKIYTTDENGIIEIPEIEIIDDGIDRILIQEINPPYGYTANDGIIELIVTKEEVNGKLQITKLEAEKTSADVEDAYIENQTVVVKVCNKKIPYENIDDEQLKGKYEVEIVKVDRNDKIIEVPATFKVNGKTSTTQNGKAKIAEVNITKDNLGKTDKYEIREEKPPEGYRRFDGTIEVEVLKKLSDDEGTYKVANANIIVRDNEGNQLHRGDKVTIKTQNGVTTVTISIVNYEQADLSLRKYITSVCEEENLEKIKEIESREPKVDLEKLDNGESTTAKYNHSKETIIVKKGDYILYTLRVYNEGIIDAMASQVVDYLPEGLEFVSDASQNNIWNYDEAIRKLTTNDNYEAKLLKAHEKGMELDYQDLQVVCRVSENAEEDTNIVNIAEITEIKDKEGNQVEDRDSIPNNIESPEDLPNYNGGNDPDKKDEYIPGQEDDDDFERILVKPIKGYYDLEILKVDNNGNAINELITKFDINGEKKQTENGKIKIENIEINKTNVEEQDIYVITEEEAPKDYIKYNFSLRLEVNKKLSDDKEKYEIDNVSMKILSGEIVDSENFEVVTENGRTKIVVKIVNYIKPDLSLRKYITSVSEEENLEITKEIESREPKVDLENLDTGKSTTAKYNHSKETLVVKKGDYILYTIRVYNEGKIDAMASQVVDYLPEGLEFVLNVSQNTIWNYEESTRKLITNDNYEAKLLKAHEKGKELDYQDLQVICKVSENVKEDTNIVNIAEITEIKREDGTITKDRDSTPDNIEYPEDVPNYVGGNDLDKVDEYIPGQEDDDDFERVLVKSIKGEYNLKVIKVDEKGKVISDLVTKFKVNDEEKETKEGIIEIPKIEINKENLDKKDKYIITEEEAPEGYIKFDKKIIIEVPKKLAEDGESYIIDDPIIVIGEKENDKNVTISIKNGTVEVMIVNKKVEEPKTPEEPEQPKQPDIPQNQKPLDQTPQHPVQQQPQQSQSSQQQQQSQQSQQPKSNNEKPKTIYAESKQTPSTGDMLPSVALGIIIFVVLFNMVQIIIFKKKNK